MDTVIQHTYNKCRTTADGRFLLPDSITTIPVKSSGVDTIAEYFDHWDSYKSVSARSVNAEVGVLGLPIGGKFSTEYESIKTKQQFERSVTTRMQLRYLKYIARVENGYKLHPSFKSRLQKIAAHLMLNRTRLATYESQLLVRDYGTHVINNVELGATLVKTDQMKLDYAKSTDAENRRMALSASAVVFFEEVGISAGAAYSDSSSGESVNEYKKSRLSSQISALGGQSFKPNQFSAESWSESIENNLVVLDRSGDPIYLYVNEENLPYLPEYIIERVHNVVKHAVYYYYKHNLYKGCTEPSAPNFSFQANVNDGKCKQPKTRFTFGGVYQTCSGTGYTDLCDGMKQKNPLTGDFRCPDEYEAILVKSGTKNSQMSRTETYKCGHWWHHKTCSKVVIDSASASFEAYWCAAKDNVSDSSGYMFGGLYTQHTDNIVTQTKECPPYYIPLNILDDLTICVSDDYEEGSQYLLPFAGIYSCVAGNPLAADVRKRASGNYPHSCPFGYSQHLAVVDDGCEIEYCIRSGAITTQQLPRIRLPPFMTRPLDMPKKDTEDTPVTVFSSDGSVWTTLEEEMEKSAFQNSTDTFKFANEKSLNTSNVNSFEVRKSASANEKPLSSANGKPLAAINATLVSSADASSLQEQADENSVQVSSATIAVVSSTGTLLCVLIVIGIVTVYSRRRKAAHPYQKI
ncbi:macrophage-expressed gene 1 protein-like [Mercenaria mercenaria]|uniref:macrophage-expressed gene 1 protein-like n=1 Tax=Mercenaria mercenaria TaxID=6596 RepID=UPI00234F9806|nr:macrophage-expressed gene 1 protein-like [Mercenaria mercenaria]